jgi:hypothetical protein
MLQWEGNAKCAVNSEEYLGDRWGGSRRGLLLIELWRWGLLLPRLAA